MGPRTHLLTHSGTRSAYLSMHRKLLPPDAKTARCDLSCSRAFALRAPGAPGKRRPPAAAGGQRRERVRTQRGLRQAE